jgi:prepilin-type N-terminal cleavage/methylation domain-containing protein
MNRLKLFSHHRGFTLIEMLLSITIFTVIIAAFIGMLVVITNIGVQQSSASAVNQESGSLLAKIQYYVGSASVINIPTSTATNTLQLFMASSTSDPTFITLASGTVYLQQSTSSPLVPLTSGRVTVSGLSFTRQANPPGHDVVNVSFTMKNNTLTTAQSISELFQSSVVHVSAATFDTGVYATGINEPLGTAGTPWTPINGVMYFGSSGNVGIGQSSPQQPLDVNGGVRLYPTSASQPSCNSGSGARGTLWFSPGGSGKDSLYLCANTNASGTYSWVPLY